MFRTKILVVVFVLAFSSSAFASTLFVTTTGADSGDCTSEEAPCLTIQYAVDQAASTDTIEVATGTYNESINIEDKTLTITGEDEFTTIIDAVQAERVVYSQANDDVHVSLTLSHLTLTNALSFGDVSGAVMADAAVGMMMTGSVDLTLSYVIVKSNANANDDSEGAGVVYRGFGNLTIDHSAIISNTGYSGVGIEITGGTQSATINNTTIANNSAASPSGLGGGVRSYSDTSFNNVTIANNSATGGGGGVFFGDGVGTFSNSILSDNTGDNCLGSNTSLGNNISNDTTCGSFVETGDLTNTDPLLDELSNSNTMALLTDSPAIDAGNNATCETDDQRSETRPADGDGDTTATCDIGAYEIACGDGVLDDFEECDDGNTDNTDACLDTCVSASCGDTFVQDGTEECDDGNADNTDACLDTCVEASCGDEFMQVGVEECDDGNADNTDTCLDTCVSATCGDTFVQAGVEECDDGNADNTDACLDTCVEASCGDEFMQVGVEECDDGNADNTDTCLDTCVNATCGDAFVKTGVEECDDGDADNTDACLDTCIANETTAGDDDDEDDSDTSGDDDTGDDDDTTTSSGGCQLWRNNHNSQSALFLSIALTPFVFIGYKRRRAGVSQKI